MPTDVQKLGGAIALTFLTSSGALLMEYSKDEDGNYPYNKATVPFLAELVKLTMSLAFLASEREAVITWHWRSIAKYPVPALIYQICNNLALEAVVFLKPSTFQILGNLRIVTTGVLSYVLLKRPLQRIQWIALVLMTLGAATSQVDDQSSDDEDKSPFMGYILCVILTTLSSLAGVYTELIMKSNGDSIHWQNIQLYTFGIIVNIIRLTYDDIAAAFHNGFWTYTLLNGYTLRSWLVVFNLAMSGLIVSFVMKYVNAIAKNFASAMAMFLTPIVSIPLFSHYPTAALIMGAMIATIAIFLFYARSEDLYNLHPSVPSTAMPTRSPETSSPRDKSSMEDNDKDLKRRPDV